MTIRCPILLACLASLFLALAVPAPAQTAAPVHRRHHHAKPRAVADQGTRRRGSSNRERAMTN